MYLSTNDTGSELFDMQSATKWTSLFLKYDDSAIRVSDPFPARLGSPAMPVTLIGIAHTNIHINIHPHKSYFSCVSCLRTHTRRTSYQYPHSRKADTPHIHTDACIHTGHSFLDPSSSVNCLCPTPAADTESMQAWLHCKMTCTFADGT